MDLLGFKEVEASIPQLPGVYRYYDAEDKLLYVGKARNLHKRVSSYFNREHDTARLRLMVRKIARIEYTIVDSEMDALLLENNLIKQHQPFYNIRLKDDKTYPYLLITSEPFPRLLVTRNRSIPGRYFGPFTSGKTMHTLLQLVKQNYTLRTCTLPLTESAIAAGKFSTCLEYQIKNCLGPCEGLQSQQEYVDMISQVAAIIKGETQEVLQQLQEKMLAFASNLEFEKAAYIKKKIELLEQYQYKSTIVNPSLHEIDIITFSRLGEQAVVYFMRVARGAINTAHSFTFKLQLDETPEDVLKTALTEAHVLFGRKGREVLTNHEFEIENSNLQIIQPRIGEKRKLLELAQKNGFMELQKMAKENLRSLKDEKSRKILETMQRDLNLRHLPRRIECFDNSNFQGDFAVSACVVFIDGKPARQQYRHFNVKTVEGPNDFATMIEVVTRRYKRQLEEKQELPDLIVVDGGKGQLSSAVTALKALDLYGKIPIMGIAKNLEELFYPEDSDPLLLDKKSITLKIIQHMRDEAHRFGITHHRNRRSKGTIKTQLQDIPGLGPKSVALLLKTYKSAANIRAASPAELEGLLGKARYEHLAACLKEDDNNPKAES